MSTKVQLTPVASKEEYEDIAHMRDNFKISAENNLRIQMLRSIFKEYAHYLKQNKMSADDIRLSVTKNVHAFLEKNKGYVNSTFLKLVQEDVELVLITDKATLKEKIRQNFIKNVNCRQERNPVYFEHKPVAVFSAYTGKFLPLFRACFLRVKIFGNKTYV